MDTALGTTRIHYRYDTIEKRLETFKNWPIQIINPTSYEFAFAGFYYTQYSDCVACYCCGLRLGKWEHDDDPINEHAYWASKRRKTCTHLTNLTSNQTTATASDDGVLVKDDYDDNDKDYHTGADTAECPNNMCKVCWLNPVNNVLIPCGHVICIKCRPKIVACHICRNPILTYNPLYL
jgi:hypothetical protein